MVFIGKLSSFYQKLDNEPDFNAVFAVQVIEHLTVDLRQQDWFDFGA